MLTQGYPPTVQTIGYFVSVEEWKRYQKGQHKGFQSIFNRPERRDAFGGSIRRF
jgi:hypothetical protein